MRSLRQAAIDGHAPADAVEFTVDLVVMEACGSAHHWARWLNSLGIEVKLLPALYVRAYVKRNKTDSADACALLEAARCAQIVTWTGGAPQIQPLR